MEYTNLHANAANIAGERFARLVALGPVGRDKRRQVQWLCQCDCGNTTVTILSSLKSGHTKSCGCWNQEVQNSRRTKHGMCYSHIYQIYRGILDRCTKPSMDNYYLYGGRGISICNEWQTSFEAFYAYVSKLPNFDKEGYSIDRIDNSGNYETGNVRWATLIEQARNTRRNRLITFDGKTQCSSAWAEETGIGRSTIEYRLNKGWDADRALTTPVRGNGMKLAARHLGAAK